MKRVAVAEGEGIGPEIVAATIRVVDALDSGIAWDRPLVGEPALARGIAACSQEAKDRFAAADATLFGSTSGPSAPVAQFLRWGMQTYANVRPARWSPGRGSTLKQPENIDFVIVRENLEDLYLAIEGDLVDILPYGFAPRDGRAKLADLGEGAYAVKVITRRGSERVCRFAFELARKRKADGQQGKVTASAKYNMLARTDGLFITVAQEIAAEYPDVTFETFIVDDMAHRLIAEPHKLDVVVMPNLYGDILSDAAAALIGGLGLAPSGCYGDGHAYFESAHGTAPDIAGKGIANPTATMLAASMMLDYLDLAAPARRLRNAVDLVFVQGEALTPDQGGASTTDQFTDAVIGALERCRD